MQIQQTMNYRFANEVLDSPKFTESKNQIFQVIESIEGVVLRKLSPGAGFFDSDFRQVTRDCFQPLHGSDH